jgi:hypothetical protein
MKFDMRGEFLSQTYKCDALCVGKLCCYAAAGVNWCGVAGQQKQLLDMQQHHGHVAVAAAL